MIKFASRGSIMRVAGSTALLLFIALVGGAQELEVRVDHTDAQYRAGQTATFSVSTSGADLAGVSNADFVIKRGGYTEIARGTVGLPNGTFQASLNEPGTVLAEVKARVGGKDIRGLAGAAFSLEGIQRSAPRPDDFDDFWGAKIKELNASPANPVLEPGPSVKPETDYFKVTMDGFRGTKIHGQLVRPKRGEKFPALLIVQWAGVYGLDKWWATLPAAEGFLVLNISAHDLPIDEQPEFYKAQSDGPLKNYTAIGRDDREKNYFLRMYLSAYRAADYLTQRPDWDGHNLVVTGTSQGGLQTIMMAGLHLKVTAAMANVPAGCDQSGILVGNACGWPALAMWLKGEEQKRVLEVSRYFDCMNFAPNIKCPLLVSVGMIDETCPPSGIFSTVNQTKGPHEFVVLPLSDHQGKNNSQKPMMDRMNAWRQAILKGQPLPPGK
jgi:cephalosporin-C deacetylase-like acetyl esterase